MGNPDLDDSSLTVIIRNGVDDITDRGTRGSEHRARAVIAKAVWDAYQHGRRDAYRDLHTIGDAAHALGIDRSRVFRLSRDRGIGTEIGRERLFTGADIEALRAVSTGKPGRPRKPTVG